MKAKFNEKNKTYICNDCGHEFGYLQSHYEPECLFFQNKNLQKELDKEKERIRFWNNAWHEQREATGRAAWHAPNENYLKKH